MANYNCILFIIILLTSNFIFASEQEEENNQERPSLDESDAQFSVGLNIEPGYRAYGPKIGYKMNDYLGFQAIFQYSSANAGNIIYEKFYREEYIQKQFSDYKYKNSFIELLLDIYPFQNEIKTSIGVGYMDKKLTHIKKEWLVLSNKSKSFIVARIGYDGFVSRDSGMKFEISAGIRILDTVFEAKDIIKESEWKVIPNINVGLSYAF